MAKSPKTETKTEPQAQPQAEAKVEPKRRTGLVCPQCKSGDVEIRSTQTRAYPSWMRRSRYCRCTKCGHSWTYQTIGEVERPAT